MKETPLLFTPENIRKVLASTKTQTRRLLRDRDLRWWNKTGCERADDGWPMVEDEYGDFDRLRCPYGQPGDRLWVRETYARQNDDDGEPSYYVYKADHLDDPFPGEWPREYKDDPKCGRWRPSIHMPKEACRLWLELTDVRVERVQEISEEDAKAEGIAQEPVVPDSTFLMWRGAPGLDLSSSPVPAFKNLWNSINGKTNLGRNGSKLVVDWDANPWVWVLTFKWVLKWPK
jgi:hypothetical protein